MSDVTNLGAFDPFAEEAQDVGNQSNNVHIRVQLRSGKKCLTTIQGLDPQFDFKKILKAFKKEFCCNGTIVDDEEMGQVIQLSGDQRKPASQFLIEQGIVDKDKLKIHGF